MLQNDTILLVLYDSNGASKKSNSIWCTIRPYLPHGYIYSSTIPLRLIPQVEGQNIRPVTSWHFFDRTSYKPSSSRQKLAHLALTI